jgi:outer membrane receptor for ferrienterochelin and colicin
MVVVVRQQSDPAMAGFEQRRKTTAGTFITRKQIEDSPSPYVTDFLRMVPGATVVPAPSYGYDVRLRGGCRPDIWIDGARAGFTVSIDLLLAPMDVEGIEVYRGPELPGRFGNNPCGAIVIWTRRPERSTADGSILKHLAIVLGALFVVYLVSR